MQESVRRDLDQQLLITCAIKSTVTRKKIYLCSSGFDALPDLLQFDLGVDPQLAVFGTTPVLTGYFLAHHSIQLLCSMMYKKRSPTRRSTKEKSHEEEEQL